jgi:hypothetical protein
MGLAEIKIGFFTPNSIHAQKILGKDDQEKERLYQHSIITKQAMSAICRSFVETRIDDLDSILGMLFMKEEIKGKPYHVTKETFTDFIKNDQRVVISDKDLELFINMNGMFR